MLIKSSHKLKKLETENSILKVLVYFDVFSYPVTLDEIISFLDKPVEDAELQTAISGLVDKQHIYKLDEFYSLQNDVTLAERRRKGNQLAASLLARGQKIANFLYGFPYVRSIGISGSVSKNFADEQSDIDYFIITKANRLWIARTILHIFRKNPFLKHRHDHYCMNYFIDEADLVIAEKNIYTATELYTIVPVAGNGSMKTFFDTNNWAFGYFPNKQLPVIKNEVKSSNHWLKKIVEALLNNKSGDWLDNYFMNLTTSRWKKKEDEQRLNRKGERMGLETGKHFSKPRIIFFHDWFMNKYKSKMEEIKEKLNY